MPTVNEIFIIFGVVILAVLGLYVGFIIRHEREHKKEKKNELQ